MSDPLYILDGPRIQVIRTGCGMSRADLAEAMGIAKSCAPWIRKIEAEQHRPTRQTAQRIAGALGVFLSDITRHGPNVAPWMEAASRTGGHRGNNGGGVAARPLGERLAEKISVDANGCWIWQGRINGFGSAREHPTQLRIPPRSSGLDTPASPAAFPCVRARRVAT